jgi:hypothetical protein
MLAYYIDFIITFIIIIYLFIFFIGYYCMSY